MSNNQNHMKKNQNKEIKIFAYGFDAAGFKTPQKSLTLTNIGIVEFIKLNDTLSLDSADGIITPQGIFENIEKYPPIINKELLLDKEREVSNLLKDGKWVCFLVGKVVDEVYSGFLPLSLKDIKNTDLCKRFLNAYGIRRRPVDGLTPLNVKYNEFISYINDFGVAKTVLILPYTRDIEGHVIAEVDSHIVGVEFDNQIFFLPFHTAKRDQDTLISIVTTIAQAIFSYRQKHIVEIPTWVDKFRFNSEQILGSKISSLHKQVIKLEVQMKRWRNYKAILTTSGNILKNILIKILEEFFRLKIDPIDDAREDAKIIDEKGNVLAIIEIKGTKRGIKREHINQVDSHRERNELETSISGILFINNEMSIKGIDKRLKTKVPNEHIKHAKNLNILIVRTIDLLFLMRHLENKPDKKDELMRIIKSGGGWLKATPESYGIV